MFGKEEIMAKKDSNKSTQDVSKKVDSERAKALDAALMGYKSKPYYEPFG